MTRCCVDALRQTPAAEARVVVVDLSTARNQLICQICARSRHAAQLPMFVCQFLIGSSIRTASIRYWRVLKRYLQQPTANFQDSAILGHNGFFSSSAVISSHFVYIVSVLKGYHLCRHILICADVPLRNYSLTHSLTHLSSHRSSVCFFVFYSVQYSY